MFVTFELPYKKKDGIQVKFACSILGMKFVQRKKLGKKIETQPQIHSKPRRVLFIQLKYLKTTNAIKSKPIARAKQFRERTRDRNKVQFLPTWWQLARSQ